MASGSTNDPPETTTASEDLIDTLKKWNEATNRGITLVTAGRSGSGKSTLISNMLGLSGTSEAPTSEHAPTSTTKSVGVYESTVEGVNVVIVDTPGIAARDVKETKVIAELQMATKGKADMLLYCLNISPGSKIDSMEEQIVKILTLAFGVNIWERAMLILTFANVVKMLYDGNEEKVKTVIKQYTEEFQSLLQSSDKSLKSFTVVSVFLTEQEAVRTRPPKEIAALPAGNDPVEPLMQGTRWDESIYVEVLKKCDRAAVPAVLQLKHLIPRFAKYALKIIGIIGMTHSGIGAALAEGSKLSIGIAVGNYIRWMALDVAINRYIQDDPKLVEIYKELRKLEKDDKLKAKLN